MKLKRAIYRSALALTVAVMLPMGAAQAQQSAADETPSAWVMAGDLLIARPIGAVLTAAGAVTWVASLPFTLAAGHAGEAAETLVVGPAEETFVRCLGCRNVGYTGKDVAASNAPNRHSGKQDG
ncbi:MAG: hypothetical protein CSA53_03475 [Gammaproteobacteria bacterium]|nr:MAG: hypothetical protein CSA53_03475 [Gammaproteobacteria bacterium]